MRTQPILPHHQLAIERTTARLQESFSPGDLLAVVVGGSVAKGKERPDSDVDFMVVVSDAEFERRRSENQVGFLWRDDGVVSWADGYVEGRFLSRTFLLEAAKRGSEPTRYGFTGAFATFVADDAVAAAIPELPVYPESEREAKIASFYAQVILNQTYFWKVAKASDDPGLLLHAAAEIAHFGARMVLAHHRRLYPCQRRLSEALAECPDSAGLVELRRQLCLSPSDETKEAFCDAVFERTGRPQANVLSLFLSDVELSWFTGSHDVHEW